MKVRFKEKYAETTNGRLSYELVDDEVTLQLLDYNEEMMSWRTYFCYNLKLLGFVPEYLLEEADGTEIEAIDIFVKLTSLKNK